MTKGKRGSVREAEVIRRYGPFSGATRVHGVTWDGARVWFSTDEALWALDPAGGEAVRSIPLACDAGTAYDGRHLYQLSAGRILKVDPGTGRVISELPAPGDGASGLTWAEGRLWMGQYEGRRILELDAETGAVVRVLESDRFVTGVTWAEGELWHGTWEGDESELRRVDPASGLVRERLRMPAGTGVTGLESDGGALLYCGGGPAGTVQAVRRPSARRGRDARAAARPGRRRAARSRG